MTSRDGDRQEPPPPDRIGPQQGRHCSQNTVEDRPLREEGLSPPAWTTDCRRGADALPRLLGLHCSLLPKVVADSG